MPSILSRTNLLEKLNNLNIPITKTGKEEEIYQTKVNQLETTYILKRIELENQKSQHSPVTHISSHIFVDIKDILEWREKQKKE